MSSTNRGTARRAADYYPTPAWCVRRLLEAVRLQGGVWCEPCVGDGAIVRAANSSLQSRVPPAWWLTNDCRPDAHPGARCGDFRDWQPEGVDVVITNPPFSLAEELLEWALALPGRPVVALLQRLNWLGGAKRAPMHRELQPSVYVLPDRPSFTGRGTDSAEYAWFVWGDGDPGRLQVLPTTPKAERQADNAAVLAVAEQLSRGAA